jgi:hypothetical protein
MVQRLNTDQEGKTPEQVRREFDNGLRVGEWDTPGTGSNPHAHDDGSPSWWRGEEDASQSFLQSMGVAL